MSRESRGRLVREIWVAWAREQPDPKPSWLLGWDEIDAGQREVDMRIGESVAGVAVGEEWARIVSGLEAMRATARQRADGFGFAMVDEVLTAVRELVNGE